MGSVPRPGRTGVSGVEGSVMGGVAVGCGGANVQV